MTAHRLLMQSPMTKETEDLLKQTIESSHSFSRLHAMWILSLQGKLTANQLINCLSDKEEGIRENALKVAEQYLTDEKIWSKVMDLLSDDDQRVRMQAALSVSSFSGGLAKAKEKSLIQSILDATQQSIDDWNVMALVLSVNESRTSFFSQLINSNKNPDPRILSSIVLSINDQQELNSIMRSLAESSLPTSSMKQVLNTVSRLKLSNYEGQSIAASLELIEKMLMQA